MHRSADHTPSVGAPRTWRLPCHEAEAELWFAQDQRDVEEAKARCRGCRLRTSCLDAALERREVHGVWGGELLIEGAVVPFKRGPGRPRKRSAGTVA